MKTCPHGIALIEDWCSQCKGAPSAGNTDTKKYQGERMKTFNRIRLVILSMMVVASLFGCASFDNTYMGSNEPQTRIECEMQHGEKCWQLPETLW